MWNVFHVCLQSNQNAAEERDSKVEIFGQFLLFSFIYLLFIIIIIYLFISLLVCLLAYLFI